MSPESSPENTVRHEVDQIFDETYGTTKKGRIQLAAYAIGEYVGVLRILQQQQNELHFSIPSAPPESISVHVFGGIKFGVIPDEKSKILQSEPFTPIEKAEMARDAALEGARAAFNLSRWQARRALRLAEDKFFVFNIPDQS